MSLIPEKRITTSSVDVQSVGDTFGFTLNIRYNTTISSSFTEEYGLYLGPVNYHELKRYGNEMDKLAELGGWLRPLATIFLLFIKFLYGLTGNLGVAIMIFALVLKIILTPLTNKSLNSSRKLQQIQPLMRNVQTQYKNDHKKMSEELRKLYAEHKVSPMGGCLPLLLQMPIFFALYPVLRSSIEFRQAHFMLWLTDLSVPDEYWILPITMGIFMFIQQKMMQQKVDTSQMDEKQAAMHQSTKMMMYIMPPFLVFIFSGLPSGLVLYWTTFNIFSIIQQYFLLKKTPVTSIVENSGLKK
jgi:YidC/Oxa1 family membrane protein insertase